MLHLTYIGVAIFLTMDISDIFLAVHTILTNGSNVADCSCRNVSITLANTGLNTSSHFSCLSGRKLSGCVSV